MRNMLRLQYIASVLLLLAVSLSASAQKEERDFIRRGNRAYRDSMFVDADVYYRKALEVNPKSAIAMFNLGNALLQQGKAQEAVEQYANAANLETDQDNLAQIYHNMGVVYHSAQDYATAIECYKQSLRNNPADHETRYNLALAQKQLKDQQQQSQDQNQQDQNQEDQQQDNQMSQENAEQLLNAVMRDEQETQEKAKKQQVIMQGRQLEKDW